jgi:hypothetical protein
MSRTQIVARCMNMDINMDSCIQLGNSFLSEDMDMYCRTLFTWKRRRDSSFLQLLFEIMSFLQVLANQTFNNGELELHPFSLIRIF